MRGAVMLLIIGGLLGACAKPHTYVVKASVTSAHGYGVIMQSAPFAKGARYYTNVDVDQQDIRVTPTIPGEWDTYITLPPFEGHEGRELPESITLQYQYAELSDCGISRQGLPIDPVTEPQQSQPDQLFYTKYQCQNWRPLPDRVYRKKLDLTALSNSSEFALLGTKNSNGSRIGVVVMLEFFDNGEVKVSAENTLHNRWK